MKHNWFRFNVEDWTEGPQGFCDWLNHAEDQGYILSYYDSVNRVGYFIRMFLPKEQ